MIRIAVLSNWHIHAKDYIRQVFEHPDTELAAMWDEDPQRGNRLASEYQVPYYEELDELLSNPWIDAVIVTAPTSRHCEVMVKAAQAGKHIFTEKVLAPTFKECNIILRAVGKFGVKLVVSMPQLYEGYTLAIQDILAKGLLGELTSVRVRRSNYGVVKYAPRGFSHFFNKEESCGGALIDVGCHPMYVARLFLGMPESVSAHYGYLTGKEVEDNAVSVLKYASGALGVVESGFANPFSPFCMEVHGREGVVLCGYPDNRVQLRTAKFGEEAAKEWTVVDKPQRRPFAFEQWVSHIQHGTSSDENIRMAVDLTKLMEASNLSAASNQTIFIDRLPS